MPNVITSASESISRPKSLTVFVMRAMRPSRPSSTTAAPMALAAASKCGFDPSWPLAASSAPSMARRIAMKPRKMLPAVKSVGSAYAARRGRRAGDRGSKKRCWNVSLAILLLSLARLASSGVSSPGHDARSARYPVACLDGNFPLRPKKDVDAGAKLDQPHALSLAHRVPGVLIENDAARDQSGDLREGDAGSVARYAHRVALVLRAGRFFAGHQELSLCIFDFGDAARDRRAIHVHVEDIQKNADARRAGAVGDYAHYFPVGRRHHHGTLGNGPFRVAKEVKAERAQQEHRDGKYRTGEIPDHRAARSKRCRVVDAVHHHRSFSIVRGRIVYAARERPKK